MVGVFDGVCVNVGVGVFVAVGDGVLVGVTVTVLVGVGEFVIAGVGVTVGVGVAVGLTPKHKLQSTYHVSTPLAVAFVETELVPWN